MHHWRLGYNPVHTRPLITVKDALWLAYLYPVRALAAVTPAAVTRGTARAVEPLFQLLRGRQRRQAALRIQHALGCDSDHAGTVAHQFVANAVRRAADDLALSRLRGRPLGKVEISGRRHLDEALARGKGVLLLSGHFYANRAGKYHLSAAGIPVMSVRNGAPPDHSAGRRGLQCRYVQFLRSVIRDEVFTQDPECTLKILRRLRSGGLVNIHFDAAFAAERREAPFFGIPRWFGMGVLDIARLSGCAVVPMQCLGNIDALAIAFDRPLPVANHGSREAFIDANLPHFVRTLEDQVRTHPEQWELWIRL